MKGIVVYKGRYGATWQYAEWLGDALRFPVNEPEDLQPDELAKCDYVIAGGAVYVGKVQIADWLRKNVRTLINKKLFLFIVCATPEIAKAELNNIQRNNIPIELSSNCHVYFLQGRMTKKELSWKDRFVLTMGAMLQKDSKKKKEMLTDFDRVKKENLDKLIEDFKKTIISDLQKTLA